MLEIHRELNCLDEEELQKAREYVHALAGHKQLKVESLGGIWKDLGFESIDVDAELKALRRESQEHILNRAREWNS